MLFTTQIVVGLVKSYDQCISSFNMLLRNIFKFHTFEMYSIFFIIQVHIKQFEYGEKVHFIS